MDNTNISLGFDIATAISIIGASIAYIQNTIKDRKIRIGEERQNLRVEKLAEAQQKYDELLSQFITHLNNRKTEEALEAMGKIYYYIHDHLRRVFAQYANKYDNELLNSTIYLIKEVNKECGETGILKPKPLVNSLIKLDINILKQIRQLMNNEEPKISEEIVNSFAEKKYDYKET